MFGENVRKCQRAFRPMVDILRQGCFEYSSFEYKYEYLPYEYEYEYKYRSLEYEYEYLSNEYEYEYDTHN